MKKIFTLLTLLLAGMATAMAQEDYYQFVDKDGNAYADGDTIVRSEVEFDDIFGDVIIPSGLFVKNAGAPDDYQVRINWSISRIDNGAVQVCFPVNCASHSNRGDYKSGEGPMDSGATQDILSEWLPKEVGAYGECIVTYTAMALGKMGKALVERGGPTITVHYFYSDPASVSATSGTKRSAVQYFDVQGRMLTKAQRGLNVVRMSDGSVRKTIRK